MVFVLLKNIEHFQILQLRRTNLSWKVDLIDYSITILLHQSLGTCLVQYFNQPIFHFNFSILFPRQTSGSGSLRVWFNFPHISFHTNIWYSYCFSSTLNIANTISQSTFYSISSRWNVEYCEKMSIVDRKQIRNVKLMSNIVNIKVQATAECRTSTEDQGPYIHEGRKSPNNYNTTIDNRESCYQRRMTLQLHWKMELLNIEFEQELF